MRFCEIPTYTTRVYLKVEDICDRNLSKINVIDSYSQPQQSLKDFVRNSDAVSCQVT